MMPLSHPLKRLDKISAASSSERILRNRSARYRYATARGTDLEILEMSVDLVYDVDDQDCDRRIEEYRED